MRTRPFARPLTGTTTRATRAGQLLLAGIVGAVVLGVGLGDAVGAPSKLSATVKRNVLTVTGTSGADRIALRLRPGDASVLEVDAGDDGSAEFSFSRSRFTAIEVDLAGGADFVRIDDSGGLFTDTEATTLDGGSGDDVVLGGRGPEVLLGGTGADTVDGNMGLDVALLGAGADVFVWDPGDSNDTVEGQDGTDRLQFNGSNIGETLDLGANVGPNGTRLRLQRDIAAITLDVATVEDIALRALGGTDTITVHDLTGTGVTNVSADLAAFGGAQGDSQADQITIEGTPAPDTITIAATGATAQVTGLTAAVSVAGGEPALDTMTVTALGDADRFAADPAVGAAIKTIADGADGADTVTTTGTSQPRHLRRHRHRHPGRGQHPQRRLLRGERRSRRHQRRRRRRHHHRHRQPRLPHRPDPRRRRRRRHPPGRQRRRHPPGWTPAPTPSTATRARRWPCWGRGPMCSCGIPVTATTPWRARTAPTASSSTAATSARPSTWRPTWDPTGPGCASSATSPPSPSMSPPWKTSPCGPWAAPTPSPCTT